MKPQYLVVDTAALVTHVPLWEYGETLCSVPEVFAEIRDKDARRRLEALPFPITMRQPQPHFIKLVNEFSKKTGDYASLSLADIKILALAYELEVEVRGSADHLNKEPRKIITEGASTKASRSERRCPKGFSDPPEECEGGLASLAGSPLPVGAAGTGESSDPLSPPSFTEKHLKGLDTFLLCHSYVTGYILTTMDLALHQVLMKQYPQLCIPFEAQTRCEASDASDHGAHSCQLANTFPHLRRWAVHIANIAKVEESSLAVSDQTAGHILHSLLKQVKGEDEECVQEEDTKVDQQISHSEDRIAPEKENDFGTQDVEDAYSKTHSEDDSKTQAAVNGDDTEKKNEVSETEKGEDSEEEDDDDRERKNEMSEKEKEEDSEKEDDDDGGWITCQNIKKHKARKSFFNSPEEEEEEQDVKVACITGDFAVQNVLKHIGLAVMGVDGKLIKRLKTYILRCHACFKTTSVMDKIFCPHCGNRTLKKVSVTVDPDGTQRIWINTKKPINKRGMKYSLPTPKGGKHGRNPILVEDQREAKRFSSKMSKKKLNPLHEDYNPDQMPFAVRDVYSRAAQLGYIGGKNHYHFYWERRNPNEPQKRTGK